MSDNTVELIGTYGGDRSHALSAWTSTTRELTADKEGRIGALLAMLADNEHGTPFEKSALHFLVRTDVATHIHMLKHRIGVSINAESARYKRLRAPTSYIPSDWPRGAKDALIDHYKESVELYTELVDTLQQSGLSLARAKESARFVLPYSNQLTADIMFNFRSFIFFQHLRNSEHAQLEIRRVAQEMLELVTTTHRFDRSLRAFDLLT